MYCKGSLNDMEWNEDVCPFKHVTALYILFLSLQYGSKLGNEQLLFFRFNVFSLLRKLRKLNLNAIP